MKKNCFEEQDKILKEYQDGKSISSLSKEYKIPYCRIQKILNENHIQIRGGRKKKILSQEQLQELKYLYEIEYKTINDLAKQYSLSKQVINRIIRENNFKKPNNNKVNKRIKSNYFSIIDNPEKAYWLGFLFTDGSVDHYKTSGRIRLQLQNADEEILHKYKEDLGLDCNLIYDKRPNKQCVSIEFTDEQIFNDLSQYGIIPGKTYNTYNIPYEKIPKEFLPAYVLGLFDGDGGLSYSKDFSTDVTLGFTSYYESIVNDFQYIIDKILIPKEKSSKNIYTSAWHTQWRGRLQVLNILNYLYDNCPRHLNRKYQKYLLLKNSIN